MQQTLADPPQLTIVGGAYGCDLLAADCADPAADESTEVIPITGKRAEEILELLVKHDRTRVIFADASLIPLYRRTGEEAW